MKILVLGGSGFLGSHVCDQLLSKGHIVTILDKKSFYTKNKKINYFKVDLNNSKNLEKYFKNQDHVINFSGLADINKTDNKPLETIHQNLLPMVNTYSYL